MAIVPMISGFVYALEGYIDPMKNVDAIYLVLTGVGFVLSFNVINSKVGKSKLP